MHRHRELTRAHYLHEKGGLEAIVRPPVDDPTALAWRPGTEQLLVGNRHGEVHEVDPVMGTACRLEGLGWVSALSIHPDGSRYVTMSLDGRWTIHAFGEDQPVYEGAHGFTRRMSAFFHRKYVVMYGDATDGRFVLIVAGGKVAARIRVPHRAVPFIGDGGKLRLVRSTVEGLRERQLSRNLPPDDTESTAHHLQVFDGVFLGHTVIGLVAWPRRDGSTVSMRMAGLGVANLSPDGKRVGLGTRSGAVAMARLQSSAERAHPDLVRAFDGPVQAIAFAPKGRWLASAGDRLVLWTWED